jgi:TadE-like protein
MSWVCSRATRPDLGARLRSDGAAEIAEAAVILPVLFMLLLSIYWFGRAYMVYGAINHAARQGAQAAAVPAGCANCGASGTWAGTTLPDDATVVQAVNNSLLVAHLDPTQAIPFTPSPTRPCPNVVPEGVCSQASGGQFSICRNMQLNQGRASPPVCGVIVSFQYPYQFVLPFTSLNNQRILLKAQVEMRSED